MDIEITEEDGHRLEFEVSGVSVEFANALRRTMIGDVPTLAVEDVTVSRNNSGLFDEILAHRIGLVPWKFDSGKHTMKENCDCEDGCPKCEVSMVIQKEGPTIVTADDVSVPSDDVEADRPETKIVDLQEDGELDVEMTAEVGIGKQHAKWQAANAAYSYEDDTFHFEVESVSGLDPRTIVLTAVERLENGLDEFETAVGEAL